MIILVLFISVILGLFIKSMLDLNEKSKKDWDTLYDLEKRANELKTKEEIVEFHKEFREKAVKINNEFISPRLYQIQGYLNGLYKIYEK